MAKKNKNKPLALIEQPSNQVITTRNISPSTGWADVNTGWSMVFGPMSNVSSAGVAVTDWSAMNHSAVYACVRRIANDVAKVPLKLVRYRAGKPQEERGHPVLRLLRRPNKRQTLYEFLQFLTTSFQLRGNAYVAVVRDDTGRPRELIPLSPDSVSIREARNGNLHYFASHRLLQPNSQRFTEEDMIHLRNISLDSIRGESPISLGVNVMGSAIAAQDLANTMFRQGAQLTGVITSAAPLSPEKVRQATEAFNNQVAGPRNAGKVPILGNGMSFQSIQMSAQDSQLLESRRFAVEEVCRWFSVPPELVGGAANTTYNNLEAKELDYVSHCLMAVTEPLEDLLVQKLLFEEEQIHYEFQFDFSVILKADKKTRFETHVLGLQNGFLNVNEIRAQEGLPPIDGGDEYRVFLNTGLLAADGQSIIAAQEPQDENLDGKVDDPQSTEEHGEDEESA